MAVEHPALGGDQRALAGKGRLQGERLGLGQVRHALHIIGLGLVHYGVQARQLSVIGRHHQLAAAVVIDLVAIQEGVEAPPTQDA